LFFGSTKKEALLEFRNFSVFFVQNHNPTSTMKNEINPALALPQRISSVDAYRGFVMFLMMAEVLEFGHIAKSLPQSSFWAFLAFHQDHVEWVGCSLHDLIQPSFSFLVGVALPYSMMARMSKGDSFKAMFGHTLQRSLILIFLGIFLRSMHRQQTNLYAHSNRFRLSYFVLVGFSFLQNPIDCFGDDTGGVLVNVRTLSTSRYRI